MLFSAVLTRLMVCFITKGKTWFVRGQKRRGGNFKKCLWGSLNNENAVIICTLMSFQAVSPPLKHKKEDFEPPCMFSIQSSKIIHDTHYANICTVSHSVRLGLDVKTDLSNLHRRCHTSFYFTWELHTAMICMNDLIWRWKMTCAKIYRFTRQHVSLKQHEGSSFKIVSATSRLWLIFQEMHVKNVNCEMPYELHWGEKLVLNEQM